MSLISRALLAGAATGGRSLTGLAALSLTTPSDAARQPDRTLRKGWVKGLVALAAVNELVADKLPVAPSRLAPVALAGRITLGAVCGVVLARRDPPGAGAGARVPGAPEDESARGRESRSESGGSASVVSTIPLPIGNMVSAAAVSALAATAASFAGARWRALAGKWFGRDIFGALLEDLIAALLGWRAARR